MTRSHTGRRGHKLMYMTTLGAVAFMATGLGCVPQDKYDDLLTSYRTMKEEKVLLETNLASQVATNRIYQDRVGAGGLQLTQLEADNQRLRTEIDTLQGNYERLLTEVDSIEFGPLPDDVNYALQQLAAKNQGLLSYDARLGMVRFASDLTFALGSAELTSEASQSLAEFAKIANSASLSSYELRLIGHTDSVPIRNAATKVKHPTNRHLSVHRAISVADALTGASVEAQRIQTAGYGQHRPVVRNGVAGATENRRVDIFIVPMKQSLASLPNSTGINAPLGRDTAGLEEPMK